MRKNFIYAILALVVMFSEQTASAHHPREAQVEVWTAPGHEGPCEHGEHMEVFLRLSERGYVTVYQITPYGNVRILYPRAHHCQQELRAERIYRLADLADDVYLFEEEEGDAQIGVIYTPEPVALAPWVERSFVEAGLVVRTSPVIYARLDLPRLFARVEADIRIRIGSRCAPVFVATPIYVRPRAVYCKPRWERGHWQPPHDWKKREHGRRGHNDDYDDDDDERRYSREEYKPEKREPEVRRVVFTGRPAERKEEPVIVKLDRRERKAAPEQKPSNEDEKKRPSPRRGRDKRAEE